MSWLYYICTLSNHIITQESDNDEYDDDDASSDKDGNPNGIYQFYISKSPSNSMDAFTD